MRCTDTNECFEQINAYFNNEKSGHFLLVNTENYDIYQKIRQRLEADSSKNCIYMSKVCSPIGLPDIDTAVSKISGRGNYVLIGFSQALMLQSAKELELKIDEVLGKQISGYGLILLDHCEQILQQFMRRDVRVKKRVILVDGDASLLPRISFAKSTEDCLGFKTISGVPQLLRRLENMTDSQHDNSLVTTIGQLPIKVFDCAKYAVSHFEGVYYALAQKYIDFAGATEKSYGTDEQWKWLATQMAGKSSFSELVCQTFNSTDNLSFHLDYVWNSDDKNKQWLLWLSLKSFGEPNNHYLTLVLRNCDSVDNFVRDVYLKLAEVDISDSEFDRYYGERKKLLERLPQNLQLTDEYCDKLGRYRKNEVFYLTDVSEKEKYEFLRCLSVYNLTAAELDSAVRRMSKSLSLYLQDFIFDSVNTKLPKADSFPDELTAYFREYKLQKVTDRIFDKFREKVNKYSLSPRPYNKLPARSKIISDLDRKNALCYFFDALGVEYLSFIVAKCSDYGLVSEISVGRCELPSITKINKDFLQYFPDKDCKKISKLDEIKHQGQEFDYRKCKYPIHIFAELDEIDNQLRKIQADLARGIVEKAIIVSDHGASRLAVLHSHGREIDPPIEMKEKGQHSGRCCPADEDPHLPYAAYEDGFSVLANYERFKGGRQADVEVHGGASLEEVVVPVITITRRPEKIAIGFVDSVLTLRNHFTPELILYSNIPFSEPRLLINGQFYDGEFLEDNKHVKFSVSGIKRTGDYTASVYDGGKDLSVKLVFKAQRTTRLNRIF